MSQQHKFLADGTRTESSLKRSESVAKELNLQLNGMQLPTTNTVYAIKYYYARRAETLNVSDEKSNKF